MYGSWALFLPSSLVFTPTTNCLSISLQQLYEQKHNFRPSQLKIKQTPSSAKSKMHASASGLPGQFVAGDYGDNWPVDQCAKRPIPPTSNLCPMPSAALSALFNASQRFIILGPRSLAFSLFLYKIQPFPFVIQPSLIVMV
jgi:hypothetical protein